MAKKNFFGLLKKLFANLITKDTLKMISYAFIHSTTHVGCFIAVDGLIKLVNACIAESESQSGRSFGEIHVSAINSIYTKIYYKYFILRESSVEIEEDFPSDLNYDKELVRIFSNLKNRAKRVVIVHLIKQAYINLLYLSLKVSDSSRMRLLGAGLLCKYLVSTSPNSLFFILSEDWRIIESACKDYKKAWAAKQWQMLDINEAGANLADYIIDADLAVSYSWNMTILPIMQAFSKGEEPDWEITNVTAKNLAQYLLNRDYSKLRSIGIISKEDRFFLALKIIKEGHPIQKLPDGIENSMSTLYLVYEKNKVLLKVHSIVKEYFIHKKRYDLMDIEVADFQNLLQENLLFHKSDATAVLNRFPKIISNLEKFPKHEAWRKELSLKPFIIGAGTYLALTLLEGEEPAINILSTHLLQTITTGLSTEIYHVLYEVPGSVKKRLEFERLLRELRSRRSEN